MWMLPLYLHVNKKSDDDDDDDDFHYPLTEKFCSYSSHNNGKEIDSDLLEHYINEDTN